LRIIFTAALASFVFACGPSTPDCPSGEFPRDGRCVPIQGDAGIIPVTDVGTNDRGTAPDLGTTPEPDAGDAGFAVYPDADVFDAGFDPEEPIVTPGAAGRTLILGTAVLPMDAVNAIPNGEVYIEDNRIRCVGARDACAAMSAGAEIIDTKGVVLPGLLDAHNHVAYNWLPEWEPGRLWLDHSEWQDSNEYRDFVTPYRENSGDAPSFCAMVQWGELRALVSGTTTLYGAVATRTCYRWLVRNAELSSGYNGFSSDRMRSNVLGIDSVDAMDAMALSMAMDAGTVTAYMIHIAEGVSMRALDEFLDLEMLGLLRPETVIIHGTALDADHMQRVANAGAKLVWSPSSNLVLYGVTTDIVSAHAAGIEFAIAPDWTPSGVDEPLGELRVARNWVAQNAPGLMDDKELLERVTDRAARVMAIDADVGSLTAGKLADVVVLSVEPGSPYSASIDARPHHVRMVMIDGKPVYGDKAILDNAAAAPSACFDLDVCGSMKRLCLDDTPNGPVTPTSIAEQIASFYPPGPWTLFRCD
jgi:cytosine/adenosine deaminase-related metal-dependent hydrolase